jgi:outer membrane protein assembly factor BamB
MLCPTMLRRPLIDRLLPLLCIATLLPAQQPPQRELPRPMEFLGSQDDNLFSLTRSQEDIHEFEQALGELSSGEAGAAVERLHKLLLTEGGGIVPVAPGRFLGLRLAVVTTLANLPAGAAKAYEALVLREAGNLTQRPLTELGEDQLLSLAVRFPASEVGRSARLRLGDLRLEAGDGIGATEHFRLALDETTIGSAAERRAVERLLCAAVLQSPRTARAAQTAKTLPAAGDDVLAVLPTLWEPTLYAAAGGGEDGRTPMAEPAGRPALVRTEPIEAPGFDEGYPGAGSFAMFPVGDLDGIYVNTGRQLIAYDPLRGTRSWESDSPVQGEERRSYRGRRGDRDDAQINQNGTLAAACGTDVVVAALQVPDASVNVDFNNQGVQIIRKLPVRRLFAFSRSSNKLLWSHFDELDGPRTRRFRGHDACGPPLVVGETVYVPIHDRSGAIAFSIGAYDLRTGALRWRRLVCSGQQEVNMFGNARAEFAASPLAHHDGVLFGAANLGVVYALELATGRIRWIVAHEVVRMPMTRFHGQADRPVYFANNAPAITGGTVCFTPLDSAFALGLDAETGRTCWRVPADAPVDGTENNVRWLAGTLDDEFVLVGRGAIAVKARPDALLAGGADVRQLVRPELLVSRGGVGSVGRPAVTADHVWFATPGQILGFDRAGNALSNRQMQAQRLLPGNLLFVDGIVVSLRHGALDVLADFEAVQARIEARLQKTPDDPAAILRLAALRRALLPEGASAEALEAVTALYRAGVKACIDRGLHKQHPVRQALQKELYDQAMDAAGSALERGDRRALELLAEARETAPDQRAWLRVQVLLLEQFAADPNRRRAELDVLEREAAGASLTLRDGTQLPVAAFLVWQRALLADAAPPTAVAGWQELIERFPDEVIGGQRAAALAEAAIASRIAQHGASVYAAVAARAEAALAAAADDREALRTVGTTFPNSAAAASARTRLLDLSVKAGDLAMACEVLTQAQRTGAMAPGLVRRAIVAALARDNRGLAGALLEHLEPHRATASDWPEDGGRPFGEVIDGLRRGLADAGAPPLQVPGALLAEIKPRTAREVLQLRPVVHASGFPRPENEPLYAIAGAELVAIDVHSKTARKPYLWALPVQFLEHVVLCGTTLVVPDLDRLFAVDYRTGELRWELPSARGRLLDGLGVQSGVLHVSAQYDDPRAGAEFLGIEPLTGSVLFARTLPGERMKPVPKPVDGHLLVMQAEADGGAEVLRLHPLTGATVATIRIDPSVLRSAAELRPDGLSQRVFPQGLCGDSQRIYLPLDSTLSGDAPRLLAIDDGGKVVWNWQGQTGSRLLMAALRGVDLVVVEGSEDAAGRVSLLHAPTGEVQRSTPLGVDVDVLNWQRTWLPNPAPQALLLSDYADAGRERRLVCFSLDRTVPSFVLPLSAEDGEIERHPQFGPDFVTFGVRPAQRGGFRLHALRLADRSGALPGAEKYLRPTRQATFGMAAVGPYTVVSCTDGLLVFGAEGDK